MLFHSRAASPGSLTAERRFVRGLVFQGRAKSPGSLTPDRLLLKQYGFRAVLNHLVLLRVNRGGIVYYGFRAVPNHLVLLHSRWCSRTGAGVLQPHRAIRTLHGSLLSGSARSAFPAGGDRLACAFFGSGNTALVSPPCRITWFLIRGREMPPIMFHRCAENAFHAVRLHYTKWQHVISPRDLDAAGAVGFLSQSLARRSQKYRFLRLTFLDLLRYTNY